MNVSNPATSQNQILTEARKLIGRTYSSLDCSHFVWEAYKNAGLEYPYRNTAAFSALTTGAKPIFKLVTGARQAGDIILMSGHMGIWDPQGCAAVTNNAECTRLDNAAPFLSSRSPGGNLPSGGPAFGKEQWWTGSVRVYRYNW